MSARPESALASGQHAAKTLAAELAPASELPRIMGGGDVLAVVKFGAGDRNRLPALGLTAVGMEILAGDGRVEVWRGGAPVACRQRGRISYRENGQLLFGHWRADEAVPAEFDRMVEQAYTEILGFLRASPYRYPFRFWNYIPDIHGSTRGLERYKAFCVGRHAALARRPGFEKLLPAASAVGTESSGLLISFIASPVKPAQIENPRQVSAFHYPPLHGPRSPLFSRAVVMHWPGGRQLYLSGTASITGHTTRHPGDAAAQAEETCCNIRAVLDRVRRGPGGHGTPPPRASSLRVYVRVPEHLGSVREVLRDGLDPLETAVYVKADICRSNLLLEIEGVYALSLDASS